MNARILSNRSESFEIYIKHVRDCEVFISLHKQYNSNASFILTYLKNVRVNYFKAHNVIHLNVLQQILNFPHSELFVSWQQHSSTTCTCGMCHQIYTIYNSRASVRVIPRSLNSACYLLQLCTDVMNQRHDPNDLNEVFRSRLTLMDHLWYR